jgi:hypothetical protein
MTITVVQSAQNITHSSSSPFSVTVTLSATTSGNCLVACMISTSTSGNNPTVSGVTLGGGADNWASLVSFGNGTSNEVVTFWGDNNCAGGQTSVVVSASGGTSGQTLAASVFEISGLVTTSVLDKNAGNANGGSGASWTSGNTSTLSQTNEIAIGIVGNSGGASTITGPTSPWNNLTQQTDSTEHVQTMAGSNIVSATTALAYAGTQSPSEIFGAGIITLKGSAGGGGGAAGVVTKTGIWETRHRLRERPRALLHGGVISAGLQGTTPFTGAVPVVTVVAVPGTLSGTVNFIQQVSGTSTYDYGLSTTNITTTAGNALIVLAGWDLSSNATSAAMPAVWVNDSAGNVWRHAGTSTSANSGSRSAAWVVTNAQSVTWVSVSASSFVASLAYTFIEIENMPVYYEMDIVNTNSSMSGNSSLTISPGRTSAGDVAFAVFAVGALNQSPATPSGWMALNTVVSGSGSPNPIEIFPYWTAVAAGVSINVTWSIAQSVPISGVVFALNGLAVAPTQTNKEYPLVKVEAAFGFTPGDPSQAPPSDGGIGTTWTDISTYAIGRQGEASISSSMGREFELSTAESGELDIEINNFDGTFTPGNANSVFYPNVLLGTPIRVTAYWNNYWYAVGYGYVERWPQEWPDLPQWGISPMVSTDAISILSSVTMPSALNGDMLLDGPYVFIPASEQYTTYTNGINPFFTAADAQGLLAANVSRTNQRAAMYVDGIQGIASTGQTTQLLGTSDTGFGVSSITTAPVPASSSGPGIIYTDANLPEPNEGNGVTVEFWVINSADVASASLQPTIFTAYGTPSSYLTNHASLTVLIENQTGLNLLKFTLADGSAITTSFDANANAQQVLFTMNTSQLNIYINGGLSTSVSLTATQTTAWNAVSLGCPNYAYQSGNISTGNFTAFNLAIYPYLLSTQRILSHFVTGNNGQENVDATSRMAQVLSWNNLGLNRGGQQLFNGVSDNIFQGPAYGYGGTNASDAVNQLVTNETSMVAAQPTGALVFIHRWALYDQTPAYTFGDGINVGEVPYEGNVSISYDNTYVYNVDQISQQFGQNVTITVTAADFNSQHEYFTRSALTETIITTSNLDVYDIANWQIAKYSQPQLRTANLSVDAASNPSVAFPVILDLQQGQAVTVNRRPMGGAVISEVYLVQKIVHQIGPGVWTTDFQLSPYFPESNVLQLDNTSFNTLGNETLG